MADTAAAGAGTAAAGADTGAAGEAAAAEAAGVEAASARKGHRGQVGKLPPRTVNLVRWRGDRFDRLYATVADLELLPAVFKTCPWQPRALVETGLRQWLRCCAPAMRDHQVIGMPSRAVDEAWHGLILCTARYSTFCERTYGRYLHHHPDGGAPDGVAGVVDSADEQLRRTVIAWSLVATPGEQCVLWDLDQRVGVDQPWGIDRARVAAIQAAVAKLNCQAD